MRKRRHSFKGLDQTSVGTAFMFLRTLMLQCCSLYKSRPRRLSCQDLRICHSLPLCSSTSRCLGAALVRAVIPLGPLMHRPVNHRKVHLACAICFFCCLTYTLPSFTVSSIYTLISSSRDYKKDVQQQRLESGRESRSDRDWPSGKGEFPGPWPRGRPGQQLTMSSSTSAPSLSGLNPSS